MTNKVQVVVVAVVRGDEDTCLDIVTVSRTTAVSHRHAVPYVGKVQCHMKPIAQSGATDQPNGCVSGETIDCTTHECDPDTRDCVCFCGYECLKNGTVNYNTIVRSRLIKTVHIQTEGLYFAAFLRELQRSNTYRLSVLQWWGFLYDKKYIETSITGDVKSVTIQVKVQDTIPYIMDYAWGERMCRCGQERQYLDTLMSWLSTLGGACSALGDHLAGFAERAWAISLQQLEIALRLGDPTIVSRCKLYAAISLIQQCKFKLAMRIVKQEYMWAHIPAPEVRDTRLVKMCQGIWAKLRYERRTCLRHTSLSTRTV